MTERPAMSRRVGQRGLMVLMCAVGVVLLASAWVRNQDERAVLETRIANDAAVRKAYREGRKPPTTSYDVELEARSRMDWTYIGAGVLCVLCVLGLWLTRVETARLGVVLLVGAGLPILFVGVVAPVLTMVMGGLIGVLPAHLLEPRAGPPPSGADPPPDAPPDPEQ